MAVNLGARTQDNLSLSPLPGRVAGKLWPPPSALASAPLGSWCLCRWGWGQGALGADVPTALTLWGEFPIHQEPSTLCASTWAFGL